MPVYTLYYFNGRGRAEICRMMFAAAGAHYVDKRINFSEWEGLRNDFPGRCLPVLEMDDGYKMPESMAICRYLAREYGFYGRTNLEMLRCDYICDCLYELMDDYMRYFHWKNGRFRSRIIEGGMSYSDIECCEMRYPAYDHYMYWKYMNTCNRILPFLERTLEMCNNGNGFFMGDQITWCDMMFYCCLENPYMENESIFSCYPRLMALWSRIASHPKIMYYLYNRCYSVW